MKEPLLKVAFIKGVSILGSFLRLSPKLYVHTTLWQSIKYFLFKYRYKFTKEDELNLDTDYIFIPFQVSRDTQIFYNSSNIKNMEQLLDLSVEAIEGLNKTLKRHIKIIVKEHPEDMSRNKYRDLKQRYKDNDSVVFVQKYNTKSLIKKAMLIITINSTVGVEALA